ncbi:hypothetical protein BGZ49_006239 [Haplosporangium sp. Z 27]|nr:hypothetical protein BGZ49_006239 [Haplosporangium sp. Z 27]
MEATTQLKFKGASSGDASDMELSSGSESPSHSTTQDKPYKDELQKAEDFIGFDNEEDDMVDYDYTPRSKTVGNKDKYSKTPSNSLKRTRDEESDEDDGPITGPPPGCPWMGHRNYSKLGSVSMMLTQELKDFVDYISPTREEHQVRIYAAKRLEKVIMQLWPDSSVHIFGSFETKLYLPTSDMDIVVLRDSTFSRNDLYKLASILRSHSAAFDVTVIAKAKVPIVKCKEAISGIAVDISFNVTNGIQSAAIVSKFLDDMPGLRSLTMLIKFFLMLKNHNEVYNGGLGSYTTLIMILSFLQMHPEIQRKRINPEDNLGVLLIEFFELYGLCYNYYAVGLSVIDGGSYFDKIARDIHYPVQGVRNNEMLLSCIDPNDSDNDTARGSYLLKKIREVFVGAYGTLTRALLERNRVLFHGYDPKSSKHGTHHRFDDHNRVAADSVQKSSGLHRNEQVSLIKGVFWIPREMSQHRQDVERIFYDGTFQRMFGDPEGIHGLDQMEEAAGRARKPTSSTSSTSSNPNPPNSRNSRNPPSSPKHDDHTKAKKADVADVADGTPRDQRGRIIYDTQAMRDFELDVFLSMGYKTNPVRDSPNSKRLFDGPLVKMKKLELDDDTGIFNFALETQELTHRVALNLMYKLEMKKKDLGTKDKTECFEEAQRLVRARYSSTDKKRFKLVRSMVMSRSEVVDAVQKILSDVGPDVSADVSTPKSQKAKKRAAKAAKSNANANNNTNAANSSSTSTNINVDPKSNTSTSTSTTTSTSTSATSTPLPNYSLSSHHTKSEPLREVEFIPLDDSDSDDEDNSESGEYFANLIKEGEKEYGDSGDETTNQGQTGSTGHNDPKNVNASGDSIQLPQLVSIPPPQRSNSSRNEQLSKSSPRN